jgi:hypothetical protein
MACSGASKQLTKLRPASSEGMTASAFVFRLDCKIETIADLQIHPLPHACMPYCFFKSHIEMYPAASGGEWLLFHFKYN